MFCYHLLRWCELVARAYYNKSVSFIPYQLLPPYLRNECLNSLVNFFSLSKEYHFKLSFNFILNQSILKKISLSSSCSIMKLSKNSLIVQLRHLPHSSHCSHCSHNRLCGSYPIAPTIACTPPNSKFRIPFVAPINSEFKIQNSKFNFSLLKVRSMKLLSLFLHTFSFYS